MKLTELLEQDRDSLLRTLRSAGPGPGAQEALERELERLLFAFNDAAPSARGRETAAAMVGALRSALPLLDCGGEVKVWESAPPEKGVRLGTLTLIVLIAGCVLCAAAAGLMLYHGMQPLLLLLPLLGGALTALAGARLAKERASRGERKTEVATDWEKVYRTLHTAALVMDQTLEECAATERWEARRREGDPPALTPEETELMASLLEAAYSGDGEFALERVGAVAHYLREKGVETADFDEQHSALFDKMPGTKRATLCPAMLCGGQLLRRGTATVPEGARTNHG